MVQHNKCVCSLTEPPAGKAALPHLVAAWVPGSPDGREPSGEGLDGREKGTGGTVGCG